MMMMMIDVLRPLLCTWYRIYSRISRFFWAVKRQFPEALDLYAGHIYYQLKERCFRPSLTLNTLGFNPIRARVGIKSSHRCLLFGFWGTFKPILTSTYTVSICPKKELQSEKLFLHTLIVRKDTTQKANEDQTPWKSNTNWKARMLFTEFWNADT